MLYDNTAAVKMQDLCNWSVALLSMQFERNTVIHAVIFFWCLLLYYFLFIHVILCDEYPGGQKAETDRPAANNNCSWPIFREMHYLSAITDLTKRGPSSPSIPDATNPHFSSTR